MCFRRARIFKITSVVVDLAVVTVFTVVVFFSHTIKCASRASAVPILCIRRLTWSLCQQSSTLIFEERIGYDFCRRRLITAILVVYYSYKVAITVPTTRINNSRTSIYVRHSHGRGHSSTHESISRSSNLQPLSTAYIGTPRKQVRT